MTKQLELTNEMEQRNDNIYNAVYLCILELAEKDEEEMEWDMSVIGDVTESIKAALHEHHIKVRHPGIVENEDGTQEYMEYDYE